MVLLARKQTLPFTFTFPFYELHAILADRARVETSSFCICQGHLATSVISCMTLTVFSPWRSRVGAVVRALLSQQCGPGSIPDPGIICGLSLLLVLSLLREVFLRVLQFSPLLKNQHCQIPIQLGIHGHMLNEPLSALKEFRG